MAIHRYKGWDVPRYSAEGLKEIARRFNNPDPEDPCENYCSCTNCNISSCANCLCGEFAGTTKYEALADFLAERGFKVTRKGFERMPNKEKMPEFSTDDVVKIRDRGYYLLGVNRAYRLYGSGLGHRAAITDTLDPADLNGLDFETVEEIYKADYDQGFDSIQLYHISCGEYAPTWKRPEVKEMTVADVEKLVGCKVKIVGDKK